MASKNPDVVTLPVGTQVGPFTILAHLPEFNEVVVRCSKCSLKTTVPYKNFYARDGCGCTSVNVPNTLKPNSAERYTVDTMNERIKLERNQYVPVHLRDFWSYRNIDPRWHEDNPDKYRNFLMDVGHKKVGQKAALLNPIGDFTKENFYWSNND